MDCDEDGLYELNSMILGSLGILACFCATQLGREGGQWRHQRHDLRGQSDKGQEGGKRLRVAGREADEMKQEGVELNLDIICVKSWWPRFWAES